MLNVVKVYYFTINKFSLLKLWSILSAGLVPSFSSQLMWIYISTTYYRISSAFYCIWNRWFFNSRRYLGKFQFRNLL